VLNEVALSVQVNMKADLREIYGALTRAAAEAAIHVFADKYGAKYDKAEEPHPAGEFHNSDALNLARRRLCDAVGVSLGSAAHC
jgi:hypothetical protein